MTQPVYKRILDKETKTVYTIGIHQGEIIILKDNKLSRSLKNMSNEVFEDFIKPMLDNKDVIVVE